MARRIAPKFLNKLRMKHASFRARDTQIPLWVRVRKPAKQANDLVERRARRDTTRNERSTDYPSRSHAAVTIRSCEAHFARRTDRCGNHRRTPANSGRRKCLEGDDDAVPLRRILRYQAKRSIWRTRTFAISFYSLTRDETAQQVRWPRIRSKTISWFRRIGINIRQLYAGGIWFFRHDGLQF
jgi:hypothetical protein